MSVDYYNQNAKQFYNDTANVDMEELYTPFLEHMPDAGHILDAGCGSGRDSKTFLDKGYQVTAFDASEEMVKMARTLTGLKVECRTFAKVAEKDVYDGIWACASLLHVPFCDLPLAFAKLANALEQNGVFYCSFKLGEGERVKGDRSFTDMNQESLEKLVESLKLEVGSQRSELKILNMWLTDDSRNERDDKWLNAVMVKK